MEWLSRLRVRRCAGTQRSYARLRFEADPDAIYAIGDVHGCRDLLLDLECQIVRDGTKLPGEKWIVMLGDYVDRGPNSAQVLDHLLRPLPAGFRRYCVAGNHELAMLAFMEEPSKNRSWLSFGGIETLASYGVTHHQLGGANGNSLRSIVDSHIPDEHRGLIAAMPLLIETPSFIFSHAGLRPHVPVERQSADDLAWSRHDLGLAYDYLGKVVVHGHVPVERALVRTDRVDLDTGAYASGVLSAARLVPDSFPFVLTADVRRVASKSAPLRVQG